MPGSEQLQLTQLEAIDHDAAPGSDETPDLFDEVVGLFTAQGSAVGLQLEVTRTDKDGDHITQSAVVPLIGPAGEGAPTPFFSFDDDGPDVTLAGATVAEEHGPTVNGTWTLDPGSDGVDQVQVTVGNDTHTLSLLVGQQTVFNLTEGVLTVKSDLTWTFNPNGNINVNTPVSFSIAATDGDGDKDTATHTITVNADDTPTASVTDGVVNEAALSAANNGGDPGTSEAADGNPNDNDDPTETTTGTITVGTGADTLATLKINGQNVNISGSNAVTVVNGTYGQLTVTDVGGAGGTLNWSYTLTANTLAHTGINLTGPADIKVDNFQVEAIDNEGDSSATDGFQAGEIISIDVRDDGPLAQNITKTVNEGARDTNLSLIFDVSGSMDDPSGLTGLTRLDVLKASVIELFEQYDNVGDVRVELVSFSTGATQVPQ